MLAVMAVMFILGFFLDTFEIILIMLPICGPPLIILGPRSGLARRHDRDQSADELPDAAVRIHAVLSALDRAAQHFDGHDLARRHPLRHDAALRARHRLGVPADGDMAAEGAVPGVQARPLRPLTPGKRPESGATSPSRKSGPSAKPKFDENGIPVEDDDPMGFSKRQDAKPKFDKDGIPIEDDDPMGFTKKR